MPTKPAMVTICAFATGGLILAIVAAVHGSWSVVVEGLAAAVLLYGLMIRTVLRQRRLPSVTVSQPPRE